jgi:uncharacterized phage infection (PIP) family protein YhgE
LFVRVTSFTYAVIILINLSWVGKVWAVVLPVSDAVTVAVAGTNVTDAILVEVNLINV